MEQEGKPQIPSLKDSQKPQVRVNGLQAGLSLVGRLKQFKKKDLAFITAGLGVLFMAPVAEHFMMSPESGSGTMTPGWDMKKGSSFGDGSSPYENGVNGLAPGGVTGGGDVITPLNVRDPSSLILGPGAAPQPAATATTPPPPAKNESSDWKDAIANAASSGAKKAVEKAGLPVPKPALTNAGLRGLGAVSGGGGGSYTPGPINSNLAPNKAAESNALQHPKAPAGFRGVGPRGSENASAGSMENLKKLGAGAVDSMNRRGSAASAAEQAASMSLGGGANAGGAGGGSDGAADKGGGGNQSKDTSSQGESLDFLKRKQEQDKGIDLQWKLKEKRAMLWPNLQEKMIDTMSMGLIKGLTDRMAMLMKSVGGNLSGAGNWRCNIVGGTSTRDYPRGETTSCNSLPDERKDFRYLYKSETQEMFSMEGCSNLYLIGNKCREVRGGGDSGGGGGGEDSNERGVGYVPGVGAKSGLTLFKMCEELKKFTSAAEASGVAAPEANNFISQMSSLIGQVNGAEMGLLGNKEGLANSPEANCGAKQVVQEGGNVKSILAALKSQMGDAAVVFENTRNLSQKATERIQKSEDGTTSVTVALDAALSAYITAKANAENSNPRDEAALAQAKEALTQAVEKAKKEYTLIYEDAKALLEGKDGKAGVDAELTRGKSLLPGINERLTKVDLSKDGYLDQVNALLESAKINKGNVEASLGKPEMQQQLDPGGVQKGKDWLADIDEIRTRVSKEGYDVEKKNAERIRNAYDLAVKATRFQDDAPVGSQGPVQPEDGPVPASVKRSKEIVGLKDEASSQQALVKMAASDIKPENITDSTVGDGIKNKLDALSEKVVKAATTHFEDEKPKTAVEDINKALPPQ